MSQSNKSASRNNSILNPVGQSSVLNRGPSPSLNNIREDDPQSNTPTNSNSTNIFSKSNDDINAILQRIEHTLIRTNERLDAHEKHFKSVKTNSNNIEQNQLHLFSPYIQYVFIIIVAIILKYIFH